MIFEDRSSYDAEKDPVAKIVLTVECAPGQLDHITDYLATVAGQAGVYSVDVGADIHIPAVKVEIPKPEPIVAEPEPKEQANGEQVLEQSGAQPESAVGAESVEAQPLGDGGDQFVGVGTEPSGDGNHDVVGAGTESSDGNDQVTGGEHGSEASGSGEVPSVVGADQRAPADLAGTAGQSGTGPQ